MTVETRLPKRFAALLTVAVTRRSDALLPQVVDLPKMDFGALGVGQGIDAMVRVQFAGSQMTTRIVNVRGKQLLHAEINDQVWCRMWCGCGLGCDVGVGRRVAFAYVSS